MVGSGGGALYLFNHYKESYVQSKCPKKKQVTQPARLKKLQTTLIIGQNLA